MFDGGIVQAIDEQRAIGGTDEFIAAAPGEMGQRRAMPHQLLRGFARGIEQQHVLALREGQQLAVDAPGEPGRPAWRACKHTRFCLGIERVPPAHGTVLAGAGQRGAFRLPGQLQHTRCVLTQLAGRAAIGRQQIQAAFTAANRQ